MKKILFALIVLCGLQAAYAQQDFPMPQASDYPAIVQNGAKTSDFVPQNWKILGEAKGDLNGDKISDAALVIQGTDAKFISKNESLGVDTFDTNPRLLIILFGTKGGYRLAEKSKSFIASADSPTMEEPFDSIAVKNGVLEIKQHIFMSAGGWGTSNYTYKLRYQNGDFTMIGADSTSVQRNTGEMESRSYNFLTRKVKISKGRIDNDKEKISFRNFKVTKLPTLKTYQNPFGWEVEKDYFI